MTETLYLQTMEDMVVRVKEMKASLFNVSSLRQTNQALFVFIDNDNKHHEFILPIIECGIEVFLSSKTKIVDNDYFVDKNDESLTKLVFDNLYTYRSFMYKLFKQVKDEKEKLIEFGQL